MERQSDCLDPESHKLLNMLSTAHSPLPPASPSRVWSVGNNQLLLPSFGDIHPRSPSSLCSWSVRWSLTFLFMLLFQKRVLFLTNDYFFTDISGTPFRWARIHVTPIQGVRGLLPGTANRPLFFMKLATRHEYSSVNNWLLCSYSH